MPAPPQSLALRARLGARQSLGSGWRPGRRRSRASRISPDVRTGESGDRSTPSAFAQSSTRSLSGTATVPPGSSSPTMDSASRLAWSVADSTASRSDRSSISDIDSTTTADPPFPRGLFDVVRRPFDVLTVDRVRFDRPFFDLTLRVFDLTLRAARASVPVPVPPFPRVPRFPLVFFLPKLRFVCRAISPSSRIRAPDGCPLLHYQRAKTGPPSKIKNEALLTDHAYALRNGDPVRGSRARFTTTLLPLRLLPTD